MLLSTGSTCVWQLVTNAVDSKRDLDVCGPTCNRCTWAGLDHEDRVLANKNDVRNHHQRLTINIIMGSIIGSLKLRNMLTAEKA